MSDVVDAVTRSRMMSGIRGRDTKPERLVRRLLHKQGFRFRLQARELPGTPDVILPRYRTALFVHGCFWHGHDCPKFRLPATRPDFWKGKIDRNQANDAKAMAALLNEGWRVAIIWECALGARDLDRTINHLATWIRGSNGSSIELCGDRVGGSAHLVSDR